jgi:hypothetical protein
MGIIPLSCTDIRPHGGYQFFADLNGDGQKEILCLQGPGIFYSRVHDVPGEGRTHFCLTAMARTGEVLWQLGRPWESGVPFLTHCGERSLDVADIDGDGKMEVLWLRGSELLIISGETGRVVNSRRLPEDNFAIVAAGRTDPAPKGWTVLVQNCERAHPPYTYGNPCLFFDAGLNLLAEKELLGAGHMPVVADLDDDGLAEFLIGYTWLDHDLSTRFCFIPPVDHYDPEEHHVDMIAAQGVPASHIAYAASEFVYLLASDGSLCWQQKAPHPQQCCFGHLLPGGPQLFVHNKRERLQLFDGTGRLLWERWPPANWPLGKPSGVDRRLHLALPTLLLPGVGEGGLDLILYLEGGWPYFVDGEGSVLTRLPHDMKVAQEYGRVPGRPDDFGYGFNGMVFADAFGPAYHQLYVFDRRFVWEFAVGGGE